MTPARRPQEYIITDNMIKAWRNGCVKGIQIKFDDSRCLDCEFCGTGARYHCCDFDDVDVEKMFRSRPHTSAPAPEPDHMLSAYAHGQMDGAKAERERVLDEPHVDQYIVRIRKASKALKEEPLRNIISTSLLIAAEHYEEMRKNDG